MRHIYVDEIKIAFDLAVAGKLVDPTKKERPPLNMDLYGSTLSMKYVAYVLNAYQDYKKPLLKKIESTPESSMNNYDRAKGVLEILSKNPETMEELKKIGAEKEKPPVEKLPFHDIHQEWLRRFDKLRYKYGRPKSGGDFIQRYGEIMDVTRYFSKKAEQLQLAKERNSDKL